MAAGRPPYHGSNHAEPVEELFCNSELHEKKEGKKSYVMLVFGSASQSVSMRSAGAAVYVP